MPGKSLQDEIRDASDRTNPWHALAELLYARISESPSPSKTAEIKSIACDASGYSVGLLNRYVATYARAKLIAEATNRPPASLLSSVFNGVEAAVKLYDLDPERGLEALLHLNEGKTTLAAIKSKLTEAKESSATRAGLVSLTGAPRRLSTIERQRRQASMVQSLQKGWAPLSGRCEKIDWRTADKLLACEGFYRVECSDDKGRYRAIEAIVVGPETDFNYVDTLIPASILRSTFFKDYYLAFWTQEADAHAARAVRLLKWLEVRSIEVVTVEKNGLVTMHPPPTELYAPEHDRSSKLEEMINADYG
jgi:hypothetical protein